MTTWSPGRIAAYEAENQSFAPQAVLRISSIALEVPVYAGVTKSHLNRGAAWIETTAPLDAVGNIGLASHRDGYFRALRGITVGDHIELQTLQHTRVYTVDDIRVVAPEEVEVLAPSGDERLTLVTCSAGTRSRFANGADNVARRAPRAPRAIDDDTSRAQHPDVDG